MKMIQLTGKNQEDVRGHGDVGEVLERTKPANWHQNKRSNEDIKTLLVTHVVERLEADDLVHLLADKY